MLLSSRRSLSAVFLSLAACTADGRPDADVHRTRAVRLDSVADSVVLTLLEDEPFRAPVTLEGPTLVLFAPRRSREDLALTAEGRQAQLLADSVAPLASNLGVTVLIRTPPFLSFRAPGRLIPELTIHAGETGFVLAAPDTRLAITRGLPSPEELRVAVRKWHAAWQALRMSPLGARAT